MSDSPMVAKARSMMTEASNKIEDAKSQYDHAIKIVEYTRDLIDKAKREHLIASNEVNVALEQIKVAYQSKEKYFYTANNTEATRRHQGSSSSWIVKAWDCPKAAQAFALSLDDESSGLINKIYIKDILNCSQKFNRYSVLVIIPESAMPRLPGLVGGVWFADKRLPPGNNIRINFDE